MSATQYTDREPTDDFSVLSRSIGSDIQRAGQLLKQLQNVINSPSETAASLMKRHKEVDTLVKGAAEQMKKLRDAEPGVGRKERAKMERARLQDSLLQTLTLLKDTEKMLSVELKKRNEVERQRLGNLSNNPAIVDTAGGDATAAMMSSSNFAPTDTNQQHSNVMDPLHQQQQQQQQQEYAETLQQIQERDAAMRELEEGVTQVNEIFKDMAQLIHDQGDVIDNIETQIDKAESSARQGNTHLGSAVKYQRRGNRSKLIICAILGSIALVILIIVAIKLS